MRQQHADAQVVPYPRFRQWTTAAYRSVRHKPMVHGLFELTISVEHDIVDGAPAARFSQRLKELIESGYGLADSAVQSGRLLDEPRMLMEVSQ